MLFVLNLFLVNSIGFPLPYKFSIFELQPFCTPSDFEQGSEAIDVEGVAKVLGSLENQPYLERQIKSEKQAKLHNTQRG